ncbi:MAG TPA: hypothetical protein VGI89_11265 [Rhizomicrobium sp.]
MIRTRVLIAAYFTLAAVPALAQSNSANEGAAATPDGTYAQPMTTPPARAQDQDQQQAQRQANSDPYNMPRTRDATSAQSSDPQSQQNDEAGGNGQTPTDADNGTSADRTNPAPQ